MIKNITFLLLLVFAACGLAKVEPAKAQVLVEQLLTDLKNENYGNLDTYYTVVSNESEPLAVKTEKYKKLKDVMGAMESYTLVETKESKNLDNGPSVTLKYEVKCAKITAEETYIVINDEGKYKISFQNIVSKN